MPTLAWGRLAPALIIPLRTTRWSGGQTLFPYPLAAPLSFASLDAAPYPRFHRPVGAAMAAHPPRRHRRRHHHDRDRLDARPEPAVRAEHSRAAPPVADAEAYR